MLRTRIDLDAIAHNTAIVKEMVAPARLMAVVKADGYNHGAVRVAEVMAKHGADAFGVATIPEARELRAGGIEQPILAWIWEPGEAIIDAAAEGIDLGVASLAHLRALIDAGINARVAVMVETGMHRSGIDPADWDEAFTLLANCPSLTVTGVFSHLACADDSASPVTDQQAAEFRRAIEVGRSHGLALETNHLANSPAVLNRPDLYFDQVRPGLILYGLDPLVGDASALKPAMEWVGDVIVVKPIAAGESTSYGHTWAAQRDGYLAVVPAGYADGMPRAMQNHLTVTIDGHEYPQVGRVCMDQILVDLGENPHGVKPGDEAVLFGYGGMSAQEFADELGTISYEVACLPKGRTRRVFTGLESMGD